MEMCKHKGQAERYKLIYDVNKKVAICQHCNREYPLNEKNEVKNNG